jgi:hypothetical protein
MSMKMKPTSSVVGTRQALAVYGRTLEAINSPVSLSCFLQLKYGEHTALVDRKIDPTQYATAAAFRKDYQAVKGLSKAVFLKTDHDRRKSAVEKFWEAEKVCGVTNERFDNLMYGDGLQKLEASDPSMLSMLFRARNLIEKILGLHPKLGSMRFGPGVTSLVKRHVTLPKKYATCMHVTPELYSYWRDILGPRWCETVENVEIVTGNTVSFVSKTAKIDRAIAIEPHVNVYAQLGLGDALRGLFRKWVDLDTGQDWNRYLASVAHSWRLSTVDLSSASDTIARSLVWFLLPEKWARLLDLTRSHRFTLDGEEHENQKFSSMGNGFTFELESIIFYALARAAGSSRELTATYGDDIIIENHAYDDLSRLLHFCGFTVNADKSFSHGSFFESCGHDYFDGQNVRPFFWKDLNKPTMIFKMINDISRWSRLPCGSRDLRFRGVYSFAKSLLPRQWMDCRIPYGYGDVGIESPWDEAVPAVKRAPNGYDGFKTKALKFRARRECYATDVKGLLAALDTGSEQSSAPVRGSGFYEVGHLVTFGDWMGPGPWI